MRDNERVKRIALRAVDVDTFTVDTVAGFDALVGALQARYVDGGIPASAYKTMFIPLNRSI
jgi:hypothetical protein